MRVPFNRPAILGKEIGYIRDALDRGKISGNGHYSKLCMSFFEREFGFRRALLTSSCTDALEMGALLSGVGPGDEVILPSYTFVSTANAFALRGATLRFADCESDYPNISARSIESLISEKTRALVIVHYGGVACDLDRIADIAQKHHLFLLEDCAHAVFSRYRGDVPLGRFGQAAAFSFHETKNLIAGEGGMLCLNDPELATRAEILWEKGTNRMAHARGEVSKYEWVDLGSSFLASEITAAFLWGQLEERVYIQTERQRVWQRYWDTFQRDLPPEVVPTAEMVNQHNAHLFFLMMRSGAERADFIEFLRARGVLAVFHYLPLHLSPFFREQYSGIPLVEAEKFAERLVRLPLFPTLSAEDVDLVIEAAVSFFRR